MELQRSLPDYRRENIAVFAISYDPVEVLADFSRRHGIEYPLLSDEGSRVIRELGLLNEQVHQHHAVYGIPERDYVWGVPYPGLILLDRQGVVTEKRFQSSYRERETGVAILEDAFGVESLAHGSQARAQGTGLAVRAYLDSDVYRFFQRLRLTLDLVVESGLHVYGQPIPDGYVPLSVEVAPVPGLVVEPLQGPVPHPFRVEGLDEQFFVHEGRLRFSLPLVFTEKVGDLELVVTLRYQACSATDCLMPETLELRLPLTEQNNVDSDR